MRTVLWVNHFATLPRDGGGVRHYDLARHLPGHGWRAVVAASDYRYQAGRHTRRESESDRRVIPESADGVEFRWFRSHPYRRNDWHRALNWLSFSRDVARWRPDVSADVVVGSSPHLFAALAGYRLARRLGVPYVFEVRDLWPESILAVGGRKGPGYFVLDRIAKFLYRRADRVIVLSRGVGEYLATERGVEMDRQVYIPNGVDTTRYEPRHDNGRDTFRLVYAGAHGPANGLDQVLDAADRLRDRSEIRFTLVGDGPAKEGLVGRARAMSLPNLEFRPPVAKDRIPELLGEADAGLMVLREAPLFSFGVSPNKLFDYLGAGLPVVCNVPGEVEGMVQASEAGVQAAPGSGAALAEAILELAELAPDARARMSEQGRAWVRKEHDRGMLAGRLASALSELADA